MYELKQRISLQKTIPHRIAIKFFTKTKALEIID